MKKNAFTLVELMVALTIISIMTGVSIVGLTSIREKAQDTAHLSGIRDLQLSLEAYRSVNGKYPDAGTQSTASYIVNLAPTFISKLPLDSGQTGNNGYQYTVSTDRKTYCVYVRNSIFKPTSQPDLNFASCPKTWVACNGTAPTGSTNTCLP